MWLVEQKKAPPTSSKCGDLIKKKIDKRIRNIVDVLVLSLWTLKRRKKKLCFLPSDLTFWKSYRILSPLNVLCEQIRQIGLFLSFIAIKYRQLLLPFIFVVIFNSTLFIWCAFCVRTSIKCFPEQWTSWSLNKPALQKLHLKLRSEARKRDWSCLISVILKV